MGLKEIGRDMLKESADERLAEAKQLDGGLLIQDSRQYRE